MPTKQGIFQALEEWKWLLLCWSAFQTIHLSWSSNSWKEEEKKKTPHNFSFLKHISVTCSISSPSSVAINSLLYCLGLSPALNAFALKTQQVWGQNLQPVCTLLWIRADKVAFRTTGVKQKTSWTFIQNIIHRSPSSPASGKIQKGVCQLE